MAANSDSRRFVARDPWPVARKARTQLRVARGLSLVEMVISLAILSVGLIGAMRVFPVGLRASVRSEGSSRAAIIAQETTESLKLRSCADLKEEETTEDEFSVTTTLGSPAILHIANPDRLKRVEVTVSWNQEDRPRQFRLVTYVRCEVS